MMRRSLVTPLLLLLLAGGTRAQVTVDRPVELMGPAAADRQVKGLADPASGADALNARSFQQGRYATGTVSGANAWSVTLSPTPDALPPGMHLVLKSTDANSGALTLSVNGAVPLPVLRDSGDPLEAGDVPAGAMVALTCTGNAFLLTSGRPLDKRPCPSGFVAVTDGFCIEVAQHDTVDFPDAAMTCGNLNARLCTWGEWYVACTQATPLGLNGMVGDWEWTNNAANGDGLVRVVGQFSCSAAATSQGWDLLPRNFRCCFRR